MSNNNPSERPLHGHLPPWVTRWIGIRTHPPRPKPIYVPYVWAFVGAFCGLSLLQAVFGQATYFIERGVPQIVASYGATAVLCYAVPEAPLAQPRAVLGGHFLSALTGIIIAKIFQFSGLADSEKLPRFAWLAASLATSIAIIVLLSSVLMVVVAIITNNIQQKYPAFWWAPKQPPKAPVLPTAGDNGNNHTTRQLK